MNWLRSLFGFDPIFGGVPRSSKWPSVRKGYIALHPKCAVCGTKSDCEVHHIHPYHLHPELELNLHNLITLCRKDHYLFGHLNDWSSFNDSVESDSAIWNVKIEKRP